MAKDDYKDWPVVTEWKPTRDGMGRIFKLEPGKRIVLEKYDGWEPEDGREALDRGQLDRVSYSDREAERRERAARRWRDHRGTQPGYAHRFDDLEFWRAMAASRPLHDGPPGPGEGKPGPDPIPRNPRRFAPRAEEIRQELAELRKLPPVRSGSVNVWGCRYFEDVELLLELHRRAEGSTSGRDRRLVSGGWCFGACAGHLRIAQPSQ